MLSQFDILNYIFSGILEMFVIEYHFNEQHLLTIILLFFQGNIHFK